MARLSRAVAPGFPHHVTQRGNRRQQTFFSAEDSIAYLELMADSCRKHRVEIWAYCLMPNHVHLIAVPETKEKSGCFAGTNVPGGHWGQTHLYRCWSVGWVGR